MESGQYKSGSLSLHLCTSASQTADAMALEPLLIVRPANGGVTPGGAGLCASTGPRQSPRSDRRRHRHPLDVDPEAPVDHVLGELPHASRLLLSLAGEAGNLFGGRTGRSIARGLMGGILGRR